MNVFFSRTGLLMLVIAARNCFSAEPAQPVSAGSVLTNQMGPRIEFASTEYNFGKAQVGEVVKHDFIFTNTGDAVLTVSGVYPGCGCTTAGAWSREVAPGQTGIVPLEFNTGHFGGQTVTKTTTVVCNGSNQSAVVLIIKGTIWKPIEISPQPLVLSMVADSPSNASGVVTIISSLDNPLTLSEPVSSSPAFAAELNTVKPGKEFQVRITSRQTFEPGNVQGTITMKTSATNVPTIDVSVLAIINPAVAILPSQIVLPPGPINGPFNFPITIRNNGVTPLVLSNADVNTDGVQVHIREGSPGHQFVLMATFPAGFQLQPGKEVVVSVNTSDPKIPIIRIPVRQNQRSLPATSLAPPHNRGPVPPASPTAVPPRGP